MGKLAGPGWGGGGRLMSGWGGALTREAFLDAYTHRLDQHGLADLYDAGALRAFRLQQVLREIVYAARHLPRWMYVPDAALPALLDEEPG